MRVKLKRYDEEHGVTLVDESGETLVGLPPNVQDFDTGEVMDLRDPHFLLRLTEESELYERYLELQTLRIYASQRMLLKERLAEDEAPDDDVVVAEAWDRVWLTAESLGRFGLFGRCGPMVELVDDFWPAWRWSVIKFPGWWVEPGTTERDLTLGRPVTEFFPEFRDALRRLHELRKVRGKRRRR